MLVVQRAVAIAMRNFGGPLQPIMSCCAVLRVGGLADELGGCLHHPVGGMVRKRAVPAPRSGDGEHNRDQSLFHQLVHGGSKSGFAVVVNPAGWQAARAKVPWTVREFPAQLAGLTVLHAD